MIHIDPRTIIIDMSVLQCFVCGMKNLFYLTSQDEIPKLKCIECHSTIYEIEQYELNEQFIKYIRDNQI